MSLYLPPAVANIVPAITAAVVNTTVVPAPGAFTRLRLVGGQLVVSRTVTGVADLTLTDGVGGAVLVRMLGLSTNGYPGGPFTIPEPGILLTVNTALVCQAISTIAAGQYAAVAYYITDDSS